MKRYARFPSRDVLLAAAVARVTEEAVAAMDASDPDAGPAPDALLRLIDAGSRVAARHRGLLELARSVAADPAADAALHAPVAERLERVIRRGQADGEIDDRLPPGWLTTVVIRLGHAAAEDADAGRMAADEAAHVLRATLLRVLGTADERPTDRRS